MGRPFLARSAGTVQSLALRSISSPAGAANFGAAARGEDEETEGELRPCPRAGGLHGRERGGDVAVGQRLVVLDLVAVAEQRQAHRGDRVVGAVAFGDGPRHDGADAALSLRAVSRRVCHTGNTTASTSSEVISETSMSARRR